MKMSKEIKVAALAIVSFIVLYVGFNFLKGSDVLSTTNTYYVVYDNVGGLAVSNPVSINGLAVGRVKSIELLQQKGNKILVTLSIAKNINLYKGTSAVLSDQLLGGKSMNLLLGKGEILKEGETLIANSETGLTEILKNKALPVLSHADSLLIALKTVSLKFKNTGDLLNKMLVNTDHSIQGINGSVNGLVNQNKQNLAGITSNMKLLTANLIETEKEIKPLMGKFNTMADSLNALKLGKTLNETNKTIQNLQLILAGMEAGNGSMGKLLKDDSLYNTLNRSMVNLDKLLVDFRLAPKRYVNISVFGKKNTEPVIK
ncbi:MAG: MCE family protein [Pseudarcicella sp.]|nr:MCE family protein [Pseudarcicella sp.]MBP6411428.1 MCE family protein [Pseudarcicella sp.]